MNQENGYIEKTDGIFKNRMEMGNILLVESPPTVHQKTFFFNYPTQNSTCPDDGTLV